MKATPQGLSYVDDFPATSDALDYPDGLLAVGGELSSERLIGAYRRGIFPWYEEPQPVMWWSPNPRSVLFPEDLHISRSLRKTLRRNQYQLSVDQQFSTVMARCGESRADGPGTWIGSAMLSAYDQLHAMGVAHSVEVLDQAGELVGGLYGIALGRIFFGESMFSARPDTSKIAMVALVKMLKAANFQLIDCQVESDHINSLGACNVLRLDFEAQLAQTVDMAPNPGTWTLPPTCGGLL